MGMDWKPGIPMALGMGGGGGGGEVGGEMGDFDYSNYNNSTSNENDTAANSNSTDITSNYQMEFIRSIVVSIVLGLIILSTIIGNVFVLVAIWTERSLHNVANYLISSLAVADLMVACLVMPLGAVYEVSGKWILGALLCDMWTSSDVLSCTSSILHLVAIALDRYWAVTNVEYIHSRSPRRILGMISIVWAMSLLISLANLGWKDSEWQHRIENHECSISQELGYQIFGTLISFYLPAILLLCLYWKILQTARKRIRRRHANKYKSDTMTTSFAVSKDMNSEVTCSNEATPVHVTKLIESSSSSASNSNEAKRERKAAKTLAIITGAFIICWLPFFVLALIHPFCMPDCFWGDFIMSILSWLGYFNSTLNPILYTIFSPDFRRAFKKLLLWGWGGRNKNRGVAL